MGGLFAAGQKAFDKAFSTMDSVLRATLPKAHQTLESSNQTLENVNQTLTHTNELISDFKVLPEHLTEAAKKVGSVTKMGIGMVACKCFSDFCASWYQTIKLIGIANNAKNDLKKLADHTTKTENEIVNVLKNTGSDLKSSVDQFAKDTHKMSQNFGHMTESLSRSSTEISNAINQINRNFGYMTYITADFLAYLSQDMHQNSRCFRVTYFSLATSTLVATMTYLQNSSCDRDPDSMFCTAPLKSMAATTIIAGFVVLRVLMPNRVQVHHQTLKEDMELSFFIPEEGIDQNIAWTQEQLDLIKAKNFAVFKHIEIKRQFGGKWHKQELEWLLSQDEDIFFSVILSRVQASSVQVQLKENIDLSFFIPEEGIDQNIAWTQEQLDLIKAKNFAVFKHIEIKRQFGGKWHKQELEWLLSQDKNIFLKVLLSGFIQPHMA